MRAVPGALAGQPGHGVDRTQLTRGVEGLGRLFKAFVSASWIKEALESWGEELVRSTTRSKEYTLTSGSSTGIPGAVVRNQ